MASFLDLFGSAFGGSPLDPTLLVGPNLALPKIDLGAIGSVLGGPKLNFGSAPSGASKLQWDAAAPSTKIDFTPKPPAPTQAASTGSVPTGLPADVAPLVQEAAQASGLDPSLLAAVWRQESGLQHYSAPGVVKTSPAGALGLGQLMPATARGLGVDPNDPRQNALGSARYLRQMLDAFGGDEAKAIAAYNAGPGNIQQGVYPSETQAYVPLVQGYRDEYRRTQPWVGGQAPPQGAVPIATTRQGAIAQGLSQFNVGLDPADAEAACGPIAAAWFAGNFGRTPTAAEALDLGKRFGWNRQAGAAGPQSIVQVLGGMGINATQMAPDPASVAREISAGRPVIIDTPGHYYQVQDYNPATQQFQFGDAVGRGRWARLDEVAQLGPYGPARTAIVVRQ